MKHTYTLLVLASLFSVSCKKLDLNPQNSITFSNGIKTEKDIESLINAVDQSIRLTGWTVHFDFVGEFTSFYNKTTLDNKRLTDLLTRSSGPSVQNLIYYKIIHQINIPLHYLDQTTMSESRKDYYRGRAYFYKAFVYFWLIRELGDVILIKDDVILEPVAKTPWPQVADYAIDLAHQAVELLPEYAGIKDAQGNPPANKFTPSKGAANALLANLMAWKAGTKYLAQVKDANYDERSLWEKSADACTQIIESGQYSLAANPEQVCESVLLGNSLESIYEIELRQYWDEISIVNQREYYGMQLPVMQPQYNFPINFQNAVNTNSRIVLVDSVKRLFSPGDLRLKSWFYKFDSLSRVPSIKGQAFSNKYRKYKYFTSGPNLGQPSGLFHNFIFWRLADIYLLRAECRARLGNRGGAIADLDKVRARSQAKLYQDIEGDLRYAIYEEKVKKEMLFEPNSFWFDAVRNGYVRIEPTLKEYNYDKLSDQDMIDGALFYNLVPDANNPLMRYNLYWNRRFGQ